MKLLIDLDGVLVDFQNPVCKHLGVNPYDDPNNRGKYWIQEFAGLNLKQLMKSLDMSFWVNLPWTEEGQEILMFAENLFHPKNICLVTNPSNCITAAASKMLWIERELPEYFKAQRYQIGGARHFCKDALLDDSDENVEKFEGHGVLCPRLWNSLHGKDTLVHVKEELCKLSSSVQLARSVR